MSANEDDGAYRRFWLRLLGATDEQIAEHAPDLIDLATGKRDR